MCAVGLKRSMPCDNLNELAVVQHQPSGRLFLDDSVCDFKRQRTSFSSVSVTSSDDEDDSQASPASSSSSAALDSFCDSSSSSSSPATAALEEALALSSDDLDMIAMPDEMDPVHVFFDFSFQENDIASSLQNVDDMTRAMVHMSTISNKA